MNSKEKALEMKKEPGSAKRFGNAEMNAKGHFVGKKHVLDLRKK